jgi:hypothetical protein
MRLRLSLLVFSVQFSGRDALTMDWIFGSRCAIRQGDKVVAIMRFFPDKMGVSDLVMAW